MKFKKTSPLHKNISQYYAEKLSFQACIALFSILYQLFFYQIIYQKNFHQNLIAIKIGEKMHFQDRFTSKKQKVKYSLFAFMLQKSLFVKKYFFKKLLDFRIQINQTYNKEFLFEFAEKEYSSINFRYFLNC